MRQALENPDPEIRKTAAEKIGGLRKAAYPAVPDLLRRATDPDETVRAAAVLALGRLLAPHAQVMAAITTRLSDPAAEVRYAAGVALAGLGADARSSLAALRALLQDPVEKVAGCAAAAFLYFQIIPKPQAPVQGAYPNAAPAPAVREEVAAPVTPSQIKRPEEMSAHFKSISEPANAGRLARDTRTAVAAKRFRTFRGSRAPAQPQLLTISVGGAIHISLYFLRL